MSAEIDDDCTGCGDCVAACLEEAITIIEQVAVVNEHLCVTCNACLPACPTGAISLDWRRPAALEP
jgi:electron transport complex protein RnfB